MKATVKHLVCYNSDFLQDENKKFGYWKFGEESTEQKFLHGSRASAKRFEQLVESGNYRVSCTIHNKGQIMLVGIHTQ